MGKKTRRALAILGLGLLLLVGVAYATVNLFTAPMMEWAVNKQLKEGVSLSVDRADISLLAGGLSLHGVRLRHSSADTLYWNVEWHKVQISGLRYSWSSRDRHLEAGDIAIDQPVIAVAHGHMNLDIFKSEEKDGNENKPLKISIKSILVNGGRANFTSKSANTLSAHFEVDIQNMTSHGDRFGIELWHSTVSEFKYVFKDSLFVLKVDSVLLHSTGRKASSKGIHFTSRLGEEAFQAHFGVRKSRPDIRVEELSLHWSEGASKEAIQIPHIHIEKPQVRLTRDNRLPLPDRVTQLPQEWLKDMGMDVQVDTISIAQGSVEIELTGRKEGKKATLPFQAIRGQILGVQNTDASKPAFTARLYATVLKETSVQLSVRYDYGYNNPWNLVAKLGTLDLTKLSPILTSAVGIEMGAGEMTALNFVMEGNDKEGAGEVDFHYRNLHLEYPQEEGDEQSKLKEFLVEAAATLFYRKDNPDHKNAKLGEFYVERDVQKDFIGQWLDGLTEGMLQTVSKIDPGKAKSKRAKFMEKQAAKKEA